MHAGVNTTWFETVTMCPFSLNSLCLLMARTATGLHMMKKGKVG